MITACYTPLVLYIRSPVSGRFLSLNPKSNIFSQFGILHSSVVLSNSRYCLMVDFIYSLN